MLLNNTALLLFYIFCHAVPVVTLLNQNNAVDLFLTVYTVLPRFNKQDRPLITCNTDLVHNVPGHIYQ